jgi:hypothetical protein
VIDQGLAVLKQLTTKKLSATRKQFDDMKGAGRGETVGDRTFKKAKTLRRGK